MDVNEKKRVLITNTLREIFLFDIQKNYSGFSNSIITITNTYLTKGADIIRVYLTLYSKDKVCDEENLLKFLNKIKGKIRFKLGASLHNKLKFIPDIEFYIDDTNKIYEKMNELLSRIDVSK